MFTAFTGENKKDIEAFEHRLQFRLPSDYRSFLEKTNGGVFEGLNHRFIILETEQIEMDVLFGFNEKRSLNLFCWADEYKNELPKNTVIIGNSLGAGLIFLVAEGEFRGVYLWDDGLVFQESTEEECTYRIANDFTSFMNQVS